MSRIVLTPEAKSDIQAAAGWYSAQRRDLGREFVAELRWQIASIRDRPRAFSRMPLAGVDFELRRAVCSRFPYILFFREGSSCIEILAITHTSRLPGHWLGRLGGEK